MKSKETSWLYVDLPVWTEGEGKKRKWFLELKDEAVLEVKPVNGMVLWMLYRTYRSQMPEAPIVSLPLEGVDATQRMRDERDVDYMKQAIAMAEKLDIELTRELLSGVVVPEGDDWAKEWVERGRPLPPADGPVNLALRADLFMALNGVQTIDDRQMVIWAIDAISRATQEAVQRAQDFFRNYMGRPEAEVSAPAGVGSEDLDGGRSDADDAAVGDDGEAVVQAADGGESPQDSPRKKRKPKVVPGSDQ